MRKTKPLALLLMLVMMVALIPSTVFAAETFEDSIVSRAGVDWENLNSVFNIPNDPIPSGGVELWKPDRDSTPHAGKSGKSVIAQQWGVCNPNNVTHVHTDPNSPIGIWSNKYSENIYNGDVVVFKDTFNIRGKDVQNFDVTFRGDDMVIVTINDKFVTSSDGIYWKENPTVGMTMKAEDIKRLMGVNGPITHKNIANIADPDYSTKSSISVSSINNYRTLLGLKATGNSLKIYGINVAFQDWKWAKNGANPAGVSYALKVISTTPTLEFPVTFSVVNGNGTLGAKVDDKTITSVANVQQKKTIKFTATPKDGYKVKEWKLNGTVIANNTSNSYTLSNLQATANVTVEFTKIPSSEFPITFSVVNGNGILTAKADGSISSGAKVQKGKNVQFTATPDAGYKVKEWKLDGKIVADNTSNSYTLRNLQAAANVTVEYVLKNDEDEDSENNRDHNHDRYKDKVQETISVNVLWHDNDYGDWKNYRPTYLIFMLKAADKDGGWTKAITCNSASFGFRWQNNWSFTATEYLPQSYVENSAYSLSGPMNPPSGYEFAITQNSKGDFTVIAKLNLSTAKSASTTPRVPISGF